MRRARMCVQHQLDVIKAALEKDGRVDVVVADNLVTSVASAKEEAEKLKAKGVDGTIFSYGVFAWPNFSAVAAKSGSGSLPSCSTVKSGLARHGSHAGSRRCALNQQGIAHFRAYGDFNDPEVLETGSSPSQNVPMW